MSELKIVKGNTFWTKTTVVAKAYDGSVIQDFDLSFATGVVVLARTEYRNVVMTEWSIENNDINIKWKNLPCGNYGLDVCGVYEGLEWRFFDEDVLSIVNSNAQANIPASSIIREDFYSLDSETLVMTTITGDGGVQSDWDESDSTSKAYIKNKPTIPAAQVQSDWNATSGMGEILNKPTIPTVPTNVSAFTNDVGYLTSHQDITGKADKISVTDHGTSDTTFALTPNVFHVWGEVTALTLTLSAGESGKLAEYMFEFTSGSTATTLSLPSSVKWVDTPTIAVNTKYHVSIVRDIAVIVGVAVS